MTLVNRVSLFFLAALGGCLLGCSLLMWLLIRHHLYDEFDARLRHALGVIVAAIEVEEDDVKWQPSDHTIWLGDEREADEVRWVLLTDEGKIIDQSANLSAPGVVEDEFLNFARQQGGTESKFAETPHWRIIKQRLAAPLPKSNHQREVDEFPAIQVYVGQESNLLQQNLMNLLTLVIVVPGVVWGIAAVVGRAFCRRALKPVEHMVQRVTTAPESSFDLRLPVSENRDELSTLATVFNSLLDRLQKSYRQQQRFTGDAAHQLRTPLTVLRGEIDLALRRPRSTEEYSNVLRTLRDQTSELQEIVEALLFLARATGETVIPEQRLISLADWMQNYLEHWKAHPRFSDLSLKVIGRPVIKTSTPLLQPMIENLISNALKYSEPGTPVEIDVIQTAKGAISISVRDQGQGISAEDLPAVFEPFFRSAAARKSGVAGTGLGLSLVSQLAATLGGEVKCSSEPGLGSCFSVELPGPVTAETEASLAVEITQVVFSEKVCDIDVAPKETVSTPFDDLR